MQLTICDNQMALSQDLIVAILQCKPPPTLCFSGTPLREGEETSMQDLWNILTGELSLVVGIIIKQIDEHVLSLSLSFTWWWARSFSKSSSSTLWQALSFSMSSLGHGFAILAFTLSCIVHNRPNTLLSYHTWVGRTIWKKLQDSPTYKKNIRYCYYKSCSSPLGMISKKNYVFTS